MPSQVRHIWKMNPSRRCSPSVTMSMPSDSCSRSVTMVASSCASSSALPSSRKVMRLRSVSPIQCGRGMLPTWVVASGGNFAAMAWCPCSSAFVVDRLHPLEQRWRQCVELADQSLHLLAGERTDLAADLADRLDEGRILHGRVESAPQRRDP